MMNKNWYLIYTTNMYTSAAIVKGKLEGNHIPVKMLNKQDSMYLVFGQIELYVPIHLKDVAANVLNEALKN